MILTNQIAIQSERLVLHPLGRRGHALAGESGLIDPARQPLEQTDPDPRLKRIEAAKGRGMVDAQRLRGSRQACWHAARPRSGESRSSHPCRTIAVQALAVTQVPLGKTQMALHKRRTYLAAMNSRPITLKRFFHEALLCHRHLLAVAAHRRQGGGHSARARTGRHPQAPHVTATGVDFATVNPNGYVPALRLDDGSVLTEGAAIVQYLADLKPASGLVPPAGTPERYRCPILADLHRDRAAQDVQPLAVPSRIWRAGPGRRAGQDRPAARFRGGPSGSVRPVRHGRRFTVADAYLFTIVGWSGFARIDLSGFPHLRTFMERVGSRPKVREALAVESLKAPAAMAGARS